MIDTAHIIVEGPDAFEFLQGQLSNDLGQLESETQILAAWCNPKGRVIWFGSVVPTADGYSLKAIADTADAIVKRLTVFRFRAKVEISAEYDGVPLDSSEHVRNGWPVIGAAQSESFTPHMLNLDLLGAVSFDKGCYTGQEIVARTHYKGATKRRTQRFTCTKPVHVGDKLLCDGRSIGEVLNVADDELLAVVSVNKSDGEITINDARVEKSPLPYSV